MISITIRHLLLFFFFNDTATTEIYTLSLHDALPISGALIVGNDLNFPVDSPSFQRGQKSSAHRQWRSEEHTSELQSQSNLVCRLLLEKKKQNAGNTCHSPCTPLSLTTEWRSTHSSHT